MRAGMLGSERGAISAEQVGVVAVVAALVAAIWVAAVPQRVADAGAEAADCLFTTEACEVPAAGDVVADGPANDHGRGPDRDTATATPVGAAARREADVDRQMRNEARALRDLADRELGDLGVWDELQALEVELGNPTRSDERRAADFERYEELLARIEAAPDGSLLGELRDTDAARRDPFRSHEDHERLLEVLDRIARAGHAAELAELLDGWAASDRRFVHVEVDLDDGTARVAEVVRGDLDSADHVAIVIPGTGSDAGNFDRATRQNAVALSETLHVLPGGEGVAVVACLCYAPPPGLLQAARSAHADAGGADLARIIGDLPVGEAEVHALGHSYGSTALGRAVDREGLELASTISLGGPGFGSGVGSVDDLPDGAGRVWAMRHDLDPIDLAGMHGRNPDRADFGAYRAHVGDGDLERRWWKPYMFDAHSVYYQDPESLRNLAFVVSGQHELVSGYREGRR
ncbi:MAG: hypothetical protein KG028_15345 [Actinobacteria bacterium]|nr:hypothetical protein [Actinomycetota bacterium]